MEGEMDLRTAGGDVVEGSGAGEGEVGGRTTEGVVGLGSVEFWD
jgi:hypothetical protein